jgi:thiosulfate/3-mercaptopyruvate sulfurtransferase
VAYTTLISTAALAAEARPDWVLVDCRFDLGDDSWGRQQYLVSHIPGAVYASLNADLSGLPTGSNGRHPLPRVEDLAATFSRLGIANTSQVVVYDQAAGQYASRLWWLLRYLGHEQAAVLDGGWGRWISEGRPVASGEETRAAAAFMASPRPGMVARLEEVQASLADGRTLLIDARGEDRFEGRSEPIDRVAGHIPGARNHYYMSNMGADGTFLAPAELRARFDADIGEHQPGDVVMYCGSGVTACHNLLAMELAGISGPRLYPGSWSEWSADPGRPVETGPATPSKAR